MEAPKAIGYMLLIVGFIWLMYELYMISYTGANPFQ